MKLLFTALTLAAMTCMSSANAAAASDAAGVTAAPAGGQQSKMATCNKDAVGKKGDERKAFMKQCLSGKVAGAAGATGSSAASLALAERTKECKAEAKRTRGNARKDLIKECMAKAT